MQGSGTREKLVFGKRGRRGISTSYHPGMIFKARNELN